MRHLQQICQKYSPYTKLIRIIATCFRFLKKSVSFRRRFGDLLDSTVNMRNKAEIAIMKIIQGTAFNEEFKILMQPPESRDKQLSEKNKLASLDLLIDDNGILRVGGRLEEA